MRKRLQAMLMAVLMMVITVASVAADIVPVQAAGELYLKLHYNREDGNYTDWSVWFWPEGGEGADYPFAEEDGEMVATMEVVPGTTSVGFIVRTPDWSKDVDKDQFIDISEMVSGTVHVYVESGVEGYTKEYSDDAVTGTKLKTARYNGDKTITMTMTGEIEGDSASAFAVAGKTGDVEVTDVTYGGDFTYVVTVAEELDELRSYTVTFDGSEYQIMMPSVYSEEEFEAAYTYDGDDLGATWTPEKTTFRVWAPTADKVLLNLYEGGAPGKSDRIEQIEMTPDVNGTWVTEKSGDLNGTYYTYIVEIDGESSEACDPYARTTGVNGKRAMVIDLDSTDPEGWDEDKNPHAGESINDAVIYELQIRDLGTDENSGITNVGKYLSLTETGTTTPSGISTGVDHIRELGITHLHIMPFYDYGSVDENGADDQYNWGYDPVNYNVPEGSYSTNPYDGEVRVAEVKQMVQALHQNDISVVMDVVYNHVQSAETFCFNRIVPGYFSRINEDGTYSNGSGCGNDTATERSMVKKYIVDSVNYWADEYHIDGFRFDLVGLMDVELMNEIVETVHETHPDVIFYGEGWTLNTTLTKEGYVLATQPNSENTPNFAYFSDNIRDDIRGNVFNTGEVGFVSGAGNKEQSIADDITANLVWCKNPSQIINYASCHDNNTLYDRLAISRPDADEEDLVRMNNLSAAIYILAEGVPFMQAGEEMLRSKPNEDGTFNSNSYASGDGVNAIRWGNLDDENYMDVFEYYKGLIAFRKEHAALRLETAEQVQEAVSVVEGLEDQVVAIDIDGTVVDDETAKEIFIIHNAKEEETTVTLPAGKWTVYINDEDAGITPLAKASKQVTVPAISSMVLVREGGNTAVKVIGVCAAVLVIAGVVFLVVRKRKAK